jgi:HEAT repeat protein
LVSALKNQSKTRRENAVSALGRIGGEHVVPALINCLEDDFFRVRARAARYLGELKAPSARGPLIAKLKDDNFQVVSAAVYALMEISDEIPVDELAEAYRKQGASYARRDIVTAVCKCKQSGVSDFLLGALSDQDEGVRALAAEELGARRENRAVPPLITLLGSKDYVDRDAATKSLGEIGDSRAIGPLIDSLEKELEKEKEKAYRGSPLKPLESLRAITNQDYGFDIDQWRIWWSKNKESLLKN